MDAFVYGLFALKLITFFITNEALRFYYLSFVYLSMTPSFKKSRL